MSRIETSAYVRDGWHFGATDDQGWTLETCHGDKGLGVMISSSLRAYSVVDLSDEQALGLRDALNLYCAEVESERS